MDIASYGMLKGEIKKAEENILRQIGDGSAGASGSGLADLKADGGVGYISRTTGVPYHSINCRITENTPTVEVDGTTFYRLADYVEGMASDGANILVHREFDRRGDMLLNSTIRKITEGSDTFYVASFGANDTEIYFFPEAMDQFTSGVWVYGYEYTPDDFFPIAIETTVDLGGEANAVISYDGKLEDHDHVDLGDGGFLVRLCDCSQDMLTLLAEGNSWLIENEYTSDDGTRTYSEWYEGEVYEIEEGHSYSVGETLLITDGPVEPEEGVTVPAGVWALHLVFSEGFDMYKTFFARAPVFGFIPGTIEKIRRIDKRFIEKSSSDEVALGYTSLRTYRPGDYATYDGILYKAIAEVDQENDFDYEKWVETTAMKEALDPEYSCVFNRSYSHANTQIVIDELDNGASFDAVHEMFIRIYAGTCNPGDFSFKIADGGGSVFFLSGVGRSSEIMYIDIHLTRNTRSVSGTVGICYGNHVGAYDVFTSSTGLHGIEYFSGDWRLEFNYENSAFQNGAYVVIYAR